MQKRVLAVHDISCVGKCSLTVALPVLSAAGLECSVLPTAVLSTHTGGFTGYTYRDLTDDMAPIAAHWKSLGLRVDAIYTGYLGSFRQLELVEQLFDQFGANALKLVDPVMADNGTLYGGFTPEFPAGMAKLCGRADVVVPNLTEASFLLGEPYVGKDYDRAYIEGLLRRLAALGPKTVVLTGVSFRKGELGAAAYNAETGETVYAFADEVEGYYHGTGDVFGSALLAALLRGKSAGEAIRVAVDYTVNSIRRTYLAGTDRKYGVDFEGALPSLQRALE